MRHLIFFCMLLTGLSASSYGQGTTYLVTNNFDGSEGSLREAISLANATFDGVDTIRFTPEVSASIIFSQGLATLHHKFRISRPLVIYGDGVTLETVDPGGFMEVTADLKMYDVTLKGMQTDAGGIGAITANSFFGPIELYNCTFRDNQTFMAANQGRGAAIWQLRGELLIDGCHFQNNQSTLSVGSAIYAGGFKQPGDPNHQIEIRNSTFVDNSGDAPILLGCNIDLTISDPSGSAAIRDGCAEVGVVLTSGFSLPSGGIWSVNLFSF